MMSDNIGTDETRPVCANCGAQVKPGKAFCTTCGERLREASGASPARQPVSSEANAGEGGTGQSNPSGRRAIMMVLASMICVLGVAGLAYGALQYRSASGDQIADKDGGPKIQEDRKGGGGSEEPATKEPGQPPSRTSGENNAPEKQKEEDQDREDRSSEDSPSSEPSNEPPDEFASMPPDSPPDPAFDFLLPDLQTVTSGTIMLPAKLPKDLQNVAIQGEGPADPSMKIPEYELVFMSKPADSTFEDPYNTITTGNLSSAPAPAGVSYTVPEDFEEKSSEAITLPDGTRATLSYLEFTGTGNIGSQWKGQFVRNGAVYTLQVSGEDSGDAARQALSSMVEVPVDAGYAPETETMEDPPPEETTSEEKDPAQAFISEYWSAVGEKDWETTYSYLAGSSQAEFTLDEWIAVQDARETEEPTCGGQGIVSAEIVPGGQFFGDGGTLNVQLGCANGTQVDVETMVTFTSGEFRRVIPAEDVDYLRDNFL